jgi:hypothetical protein
LPIAARGSIGATTSRLLTHPAARQCAARRHDDRRHCRDPGNARQRPDAVLIEICRREDAAHAGHRAGSRGLDAHMSMPRSQHHAVHF